MTNQPLAGIARRPGFLVAIAWLIPAAGHFLLGKRRRALVFAAVICSALATGATLEGNLYVPTAGQPMSYLATMGAMGSGLPYFLLRFGADYQGDSTGSGYEYGTAFLLSAGLMNLLLVLDTWDLATGRKS